uniref:Putative conserved plasma membrane protein n=2 Tax=Triatoma infestans TaxID=30076 RepID=A0A023F8A8_TRIIF
MPAASYYTSFTTPTSVYTLVYITIMTCFILRTKEFVSAGFVIENLFDWLLKKEHEDFIHYHIRRTALTIFVHSLLPLGYIFGLAVVIEDLSIITSLDGLYWSALILFSHFLPLTASFFIMSWAYDGWDSHPIARTLRLFCPEGTTWKQLASTINADYRGIDKICLEPSSMTKVIVTDTWIMKITPYNLNLAHQSDTTLVVCSSDTHHISVDGEGTVQYVTIEVKTIRPGLPSFFIRCNALDFNDLKNKIGRPIRILEGITFHKTRTDHFLEVFRETVEKNPTYTLQANQELDTCIGCMLMEPQVKLVKSCNNSQCTICYCRPLWCLDCMAKWYASRQDQDRPETWLSSTCTCPVCRSVFCVLDVCLIIK